MKYIYTCLFLLPIYILSAQDRIYVRSNATGTNNGQSWANAYSNLQTALTTVQAGDELWVAQGIYRPTEDGNRDTAFQLPSGVRLYGGFAGTESSLDQRDWQAHLTVLSGDIGVPGDSTDNSYTILYLDNPDSMTIVDGLIFRFGNAGYLLNDQVASSRYRSGGAMYILAAWEAFALIRNCRFEHNTARNNGGAVYVHGAGSPAAAPIFQDCMFEWNTAGQSGGAVHRVGNSDLERADFTGCSFRFNRAGTFGGALYYLEGEGDSRFHLTHCTFFRNEALNSGGIAALRVGRAGGTKVRVTNCRFEENKVGYQFGELALLNRPAPCQEVVVENCSFLKGLESAMTYDVLGTDQSELKITGCRFEGYFSPAALIAGDQVYNFTLVQDSIINCLSNILVAALGLKKNHYDRMVFKNIRNLTYVPSTYPGSFLVTNSLVESSSLPEGIMTVNSPNNIMRFTSCTFVNNHFNYLFSSFNDSTSAELYNCSFNHCSITYYPFQSYDFLASLNYCSFDSTDFCMPTADNTQHYNVVCGPGNLFGIDPMFRDTTIGDYSLLPCSPLIDAGENVSAASLATDLDGNLRILGGRVDIGAYEASALALGEDSQVHSACFGVSNGSIAVSPTFGCEPYSFNWSPSAGNGPQLNGLPPGVYLLTITDGLGRQLYDTIQVIQAPLPMLQAQSTNVQCGTVTGGSISANVVGGTPPYHYQWLPTAADTSYLSHLPMGDYVLTVVDENGCQDSISVGVALQGALVMQVDGQVISCHNYADGWFSATPLTGMAPFSWIWQGWSGVDSIAQPLGPGLYAVTVADAFGCKAAFAFPPLVNPDELSLQAASNPQTNLTMPNGQAMVIATVGGTPGYHYSWSTNESGTSISGLTAGEYTATVTDENGCTATATTTVQLIVGTGNTREQALLVYPNPTSDWLTVALPSGKGDQIIELYDSNGQKVLHRLALESSFTLDLHNLPAGAYTLCVHARSAQSGATFVARVFKQ